MSDGRAFYRFLTLLGLIVLCASPCNSQGRGQGNGRNSDHERDDSNPVPRVQTTTPTPTPEPVVVVPGPRRVPRKPPPRRKPVVVPGDRVVAMTDEVRKSDIHTTLGTGAFALTPDGRPEFIAVGPLAESTPPPLSL